VFRINDFAAAPIPLRIDLLVLDVDDTTMKCRPQQHEDQDGNINYNGKWCLRWCSSSLATIVARARYVVFCTARKADKRHVQWTVYELSVAGIVASLDHVVCTGTSLKGRYVSGIVDAFAAAAAAAVAADGSVMAAPIEVVVFVDDKAASVEDVVRRAPNVLCFQFAEPRSHVTCPSKVVQYSRSMERAFVAKMPTAALIVLPELPSGMKLSISSIRGAAGAAGAAGVASIAATASSDSDGKCGFDDANAGDDYDDDDEEALASVLSTSSSRTIGADVVQDGTDKARYGTASSSSSSGFGVLHRAVLDCAHHCACDQHALSQELTARDVDNPGLFGLSPLMLAALWGPTCLLRHYSAVSHVLRTCPLIASVLELSRWDDYVVVEEFGCGVVSSRECEASETAVTHVEASCPYHQVLCARAYFADIAAYASTCASFERRAQLMRDVVLAAVDMEEAMQSLM
jgi:hypothetical protein